jgi:hypothetical protein
VAGGEEEGRQEVIFYDVEQGSPTWHTLRRGIPTASEFDKIITPAKGELSKQWTKYAAQLIGDVTSPYYPEHAESFTNRAVRWGQECEESARRWYAAHHSVNVTNGGFCMTDDKRFGCSPDGLVNGDGALELKCPNASTHAEYLMAGQILPAEYKPQVHGELIVTGRKWVDFVSYAPGLPALLVRVTEDDFTAKLRAALEEFYPKFRKLLGEMTGKIEQATPATTSDGEIIENGQYITQAQYDELSAEIEKREITPDGLKRACAALKIDSMRHLPPSEYEKTLGSVRKKPLKQPQEAIP